MAWVVLGLSVGVGVLGIGPAGAATELTLSPASGPPGTEFVVTGTGFAAAAVEIRWGGLTGPVIATATGPEFSVPALVPDSPPNSHPVMAVVTDRGSVSTSSASFQVTPGPAPAPAPVETTTTTSPSTTIAQPPATNETVRIPAGETGRSPVQSGTPRGGLSGGVDGGAEGGGDTTNGGGATGAASTGAGGAGGAGSTVTTPAAEAAGAAANAAANAETAIPTVTLPPAGGPGPAPTGQDASAAPLSPGDGVAAAASVPGRTTQSAGAVSNPALLFLGLALVFGGGVFLAVRNRQRA